MKNRFARFAALALTPVLLFGAPLLARASTPTVIDVTTVITPDAAVAAARVALNTDSDVREVTLETEHGAQVYEIKFVNGMRALVDASTSEVVRTRAERRHDRDVDQHGSQNGIDHRATPAIPAVPARNGQPATPATPAVPASRVEDGAHNSGGTHVETEVHGNPAEVSHGGTHVETEVHGNPTEVVHSGGNGGGNSGRGNSGGGNSGRR